MKAVVVGGGIFGASTAYALSRAGVRVSVVDRADTGRATAAGAGIVCPWLSRTDPAYYAFAERCGAYYGEILARLAADGEGETGYQRVGSIVVPEDVCELDVVEARLADRHATAPEMGQVRRLSNQEARALFPALRADRPAIHIEGTGRVDGRLLARALLAAAAKRGCEVIAAPVDRILSSNGQVTGVEVAGKPKGADLVILAGGAWAPSLLAPLGFDLKIAPQRGQIVHLRLAGVDTASWPVLQPINGYYLLAFPDSRIVVGATRETGTGFDHRITAAGITEVLTTGLRFAPGLAGAEVIETRVGFRPMSFDNRPMIGAVTSLPGLLVGNGLGAGGLTMGPYAGQMLADIARGIRPELDLSTFDPMRP